jgi:hypothetical protein
LRRQFLTDEYSVADAFDAPARDGVKRRRTQGFTGSETEACMMQGAPELIPDDQSFDEGTAIVGAARSDCEKLIA